MLKPSQISSVVLYDSSSSYGIEIITMEGIEDITLGSSDFTVAMNSYNDSISILNNATNKYMNTIYTDRARSVGSVPNNSNSQSGYYYDTEILPSEYNGKFRDTDSNYVTDWNQMRTLEIQNINENYWLASRYVWTRVRLKLY